jgi:alkaline phosphatase D
MLGAEQERWLFDHLATVNARWTVIGQQVPTFARNFAGRFMMDKWDGYVAARERLYSRLSEAKTPNPIVLSGDVHTHWGADLKQDFGNPRSPTVGVEFTNTSISSDGDGADTQGDWERIRPDNPHIKYHSARRGYIACTVTPSTVRADFTVLDRVTSPGAAARVGGSLVVEAGRAGCEIA